MSDAAEPGPRRNRRRVYGVFAGLWYALAFFAALAPVHPPEALNDTCGAALFAVTKLYSDPDCFPPALERMRFVLLGLLLAAPCAVAYVAACVRERR